MPQKWELGNGWQVEAMASNSQQWPEERRDHFTGDDGSRLYSLESTH